jgi:hypothetical protein
VRTFRDLAKWSTLASPGNQALICQPAWWTHEIPQHVKGPSSLLGLLYHFEYKCDEAAKHR